MVDVDVVVVGGGPIGLTAAVSLLREGFKVTVCESKSELVRLPKASTFHPPTLEMLDEIGLAEPLIERGYRVDHIQYRERTGGVVARFDYGVIADDVRFPFRLQCPQDELVEIASEVVQNHPNGEVRWGCEVTDLQQGADSATVHLAGNKKIEARYVLGADGASSVVRRILGIDFVGKTYTAQNLQMVTRHDFASVFEDLDLVNYVFDPIEWCAIMRTPPGIWRVLFPLGESETAESALSETRIQERMQRLVGNTNEEVIVDYSAVYTIHQRIAERMLLGRTLLIGDAAHVNSPLGGMGMNSGIHDVHYLREPFAKVLKGKAEDHVLQEWAQRRHDIAHRFVGRITDGNASTMAQADEAARQRRNDELAAMAADPASAREYMRRTSMLDQLG